jgi:hypothetical protein
VEHAVHSSGTVLKAMSCKIERIESGEGFVVLRVSGRIDGEHVDTLRELIAEEKGAVAIDLTEVLLADREAVSLFAVSEANGAQLRNCPAYIREWAAKERDRTRSQLSSPNTGETI